MQFCENRIAILRHSSWFLRCTVADMENSYVFLITVFVENILYFAEEIENAAALEGNNEEDEMGRPVPDGGCDTGGTLLAEPEADWMEIQVIMGFRVWQLMFLALAGLITVVVLLCCFMKCRVPRTKQEIEADYKRKEITKRFRFLLDKVPIEDTSLRTALDKVTELYKTTEKMKRQRKKKDGLPDEEIGSFDSNELFAEEKLTLFGRIKKILGLQKDDESEGEESTRKSDFDQSEAKTKASDSEDDEEDTASSETHKSRAAHKKSPLPQQLSNESQESSGSQKPDALRSTLTLLQETPTRSRDLSSRLSLLQDSPPDYTPTLLEDTPPTARSQKQLVKKKSSSQESEQSGTSEHSKQKTDSQESRDSKKSRSNTQKSDSQESKSSDANGRRESMSSSVTLLKEFPRQENKLPNDSKKNKTFPRGKKSTSKDYSTHPSSSSKETSFVETNVKTDVDGEVQNSQPK